MKLKAVLFILYCPPVGIEILVPSKRNAALEVIEEAPSQKVTRPFAPLPDKLEPPAPASRHPIPIL